MPKTKPTKTPKPAQPPGEGDARREGKKNVRWQDDPDILERLVKVADMVNRHRRGFEIARENKVSIETARRDIARVREIWRQDSKERLQDAKDVALAQYSAVIRQAWGDMQKVRESNPARAAFQNVVLRAQRQMDTVNGIAEKREISGPDGGPIEHKIVDVEKIRKKRWEQIAPNLQAMVKKESDDESTNPTEADDKES